MAARFSIGSHVYLIESAQSGNLESVKVTGVRQALDGNWYYTISISQRPPITGPLGDMNVLRSNYEYELPESSFVTLCEAINIIESFHVVMLAKIRSMKDQYCNG